MTLGRCLIVPDYLLARLAQDADPRVAQGAERTLQASRGIVGLREVRAARRAEEGASGLLPPDLLARVQPLPETEPAAAVGAPSRSIHDAQQGRALPGVLVRAEGDEPVADESVNEAYDGLGQTHELFASVYGRDSLDGRGLPLVATVHYDRDFDNAFWDGEQMVFGDGDGVYFNSFTDSVDVIGHELAHGFTQYTVGFTYVGQSGALNESVSDVFGSLVKQRVLGQTAAEADWLIGEHLFTDKVHGVALRSMKAPGTAYDDPTLGQDPQPATMAGYVDLPHDAEHDNGGVHINSGIPNHAFYLAAAALGGSSWEVAGQVWYDVMTVGGLPRDATFTAFAEATLTQAEQRFGAAEEAAIEQAWRDVGVL